MSKVWNIKPYDKEKSVPLADALGTHPFIAHLLLDRGLGELDSARHFLSSELTDCHDPFLLKDMDKVTKRIKYAQEMDEKVLVYGDYDVDGVTSSTILNQLLKKAGIRVCHYIPHRMTDGYGLNHDVAQYAKDEGVSLIISIDCGITAVDEVRTINDMGLDIIIIDHHEPGEEVPQAHAIINPKQKDCRYPFKELASVGLAFKLAHAFEGRMNEDFLDIAAIGTIADVVPLYGENRILVKQGLPRVNETKNIGLKTLLKTTKIHNKVLSPFHIGFVLGPRINAAGRMDSAHISLDLFLSEDDIQAQEIANLLEKHNLARQKMQRDVIQEAFELIDENVDEKQKVIVVGKEGWHKGVVGIAASRITDKYYRPSIVISIKDGIGTASARSIDGFHLHEMLSNCSECLENFGGHECAAGLTIKAENIDPFRKMINEVAEKFTTAEKLTPVVNIDCDIRLDQISLELAHLIDELQPYGEGNPVPVFCTRKVAAKSYPQLLGRDTLKFWVQADNTAISVVGFGMARFKDLIRPGELLDIAYEIIIDDWNKAPTPQLKLKDIKVSE